MNQFLTYSALSKILSLLKKENAKSFRITMSGSHPKFECMQSGIAADDVILSLMPRVYTNADSLPVLSCAIIDYNYTSGDFVISKNKLTQRDLEYELSINA